MCFSISKKELKDYFLKFVTEAFLTGSVSLLIYIYLSLLGITSNKISIPSALF